MKPRLAVGYGMPVDSGIVRRIVSLRVRQTRSLMGTLRGYSSFNIRTHYSILTGRTSLEGFSKQVVTEKKNKKQKTRSVRTGTVDKQYSHTGMD